MINSKYGWSLAAILVPVAFIAGFAVSNKKKQSTPMSNSTRIFLNFDIDRVITSGSPVNLEIELKNEGPGEVEYLGEGDFVTMQIWIRDSEGTFVEYNQTGWQSFGPTSQLATVGQSTFEGYAGFTLSSGQTASQSYAMENFFESLDIGEYQVYGSLKDGWITENGVTEIGGSAEVVDSFQIEDGAFLGAYQEVIGVPQADLWWTSFAETGDYVVERSTESSTSGFVQIATVASPETHYADPNLDEETDYWYRITTSSFGETNVAEFSLSSETVPE